MQFRTTLIAAFCCAISLPALAADWPNYRGPTHNGVSAEKDFLDQFPPGGPKAVWKANVGLGFSGVVVANGRAYTLGWADGKDTVTCLDAASGKVVWQHSYAAELGDKFYEGGTTGTPTADGDKVYSLSRWGDLFCFDAANGKIAWSRNIQKDADLVLPMWGFTGAPLVQGDLLILTAGEAGMAVEKETGKTVWQSGNKAAAGFSTPYPLTIDNKPAVIVSSGQAYVAVDVATGKEHWRVKWLTQYGVNAADPVVDGDKMFLSTGYGKGDALFKLNAGAAPTEIYKSKVLRTQLNPAVLHNGFLYGVDGDTSERASFKCVELATGTEKWAQKNFGNGAAILAGGDKLILLSGDGELMIAPASPEAFKPTARAKVITGKTWTAPTLANGYVFCRSGKGEIVCLDLRKP